MSAQITLDQFERDHPHPDKIGVDRLFHFRRVLGVEDWLLEHLFLHGKLYHSSPSKLNDPFECKPHYREPESEEQWKALLAHIFNVFLENGMREEEARRKIAENLIHPEILYQRLHKTGIDTFADLRMCSFTTSKDNLLMWSHYGASHTGICIEFDASIWPINGVRKVKYQDQYPQFAFPQVEDERNIQAALIKSKAWEYEEEFRHIFVPGADAFTSDGDSISLHPETITGLYFGADVGSQQQQRIIGMVKRGPFNPRYYQGVLSSSEFRITFGEMKI